MNKSYACKSWVIHKQWSGETSANVFFFTEEHGIIRALCKGGRLPKKQMLLQAFTPLWVDFQERTSSCYVKHLELSAPTLTLQGTNLFAGLYINELIYHALRLMDAYPLLFEAYQNSLQALKEPLEPAQLAQSLRHVEMTLLNEMGYSISLTQEGRSGEAIVFDKQYELNIEEGLVETPHGIPGEYILAWNNDQWHRQEVRQTAKTVTRKMLAHVLGGKVLRTRELYTPQSTEPFTSHCTGHTQ